MMGPILIIEDEPRNMKLVRDALVLTGYKTEEAYNGEEGVKLAKACNPVLILMDLQMPVMDGLEATQKLKADPATLNIPIIALTALAMKGDEERVRAAGCDGYLSKPIRLSELKELVRQFLDGQPAISN
ncbi:response regulator [Motiliproteus sp. MSK22-1]|uniref:response regulator n=1 Tax=Motiliproteus sp. MSK22-1 TaxID=1897630 RepID=UPI000978CA1F|nr:response regulator [Motiliproteus sp. MSK22-1]OMH32681.1 hypothetical protein BGP75_14150 [Motiliproteus sp. MSK22-1]